MLFGQANRTILGGETALYHLDLYCNLYVINGNPFGQGNNGKLDEVYPQKYMVYLASGTQRLLIDELRKDNDGVYKLKFKTKDISKYIGFSDILIVHAAKGVEQTILQGKFTNPM